VLCGLVVPEGGGVEVPAGRGGGVRTEEVQVGFDGERWGFCF